jgi:PAS domain S-box-containing protein
MNARSNIYRLPVGRWPAPRLRALQVEEAFRLAPIAAISAFLASVLVLPVLFDIGEGRRAVVWFVGGTLVALARGITILLYRRREDDAQAERWGQSLVATNVLSGIQWGLLGTFLFPSGPPYAQLFVVMVVACLAAVSMTTHAVLPAAHEAITLAAVLPMVVYLFFVRDGVHVAAGSAGLLLCAAMVFHARRLQRRLERELETRIERDDLLAISGVLHEKSDAEKRVLAHRAAVRGASAAQARESAERLESLFLASPLPHLQVDGHGLVLRANEAAERLFGVGRDGLEGESAPGLLPGLDLRRSPASLAVGGETPGGALHATAHVCEWRTSGGSKGFGVTLSGASVAATVK